MSVWLVPSGALVRLALVLFARDLIPYAYRSEEHGWLDLFAVIPTVLIDRPRWLHLVHAAGKLADAIAEVPRTWILDELPGLLVA